jgi:quercetin dioxygenase-like cupin family protein
MKIELNLKELDFSAERIVTKAIAGTENFKIVQLVLSEGQELKTHTTPVDAVLLIIEGTVEYQEESGTILLKEQDVYQIRKNIPHSVKAKTNSRLLLIR